MEKETREQYAARRSRIAEARDREHAVHDALKRSGRLGAPRTTASLLRLRHSLAAEGDYKMAAIVHEVVKLRAALRRSQGQVVTKLDDLQEAVAAMVSTVYGQGVKDGANVVLEVRRPTPGAVREQRGQRKRARRRAKQEKQERTAIRTIGALS